MLSTLSTNKRIVTDYLEYLKAVEHLSPLTLKQYKVDIMLFLKFLKRRVKDITKEDIIKYLAFLDKKELENSTIRKKIVILKAFFNWLEDQGKISLSPFYKLKIKNHKPNKKLLKTLSSAQIPKVLRPQEEIANMNFKELRNECIVRLFLSTGMRRCELIKLELQDIDFKNKEICILYGKGRKERIVPFDKTTAYWLTEYLKQREQYNGVSNNLFITTAGKSIKEGVIRYLIDGRFKEAKIKYYSDKENRSIGKGMGAHSFRHTFATKHLENGADSKIVQELLGHANIQTTLNIYSHPSREHIKKVYNMTNIFKNVKNVSATG